VLKTIIGVAKLNAMMKKLRGGPQSMMPISPGKGLGVKGAKGLTLKMPKNYVTRRQNPSLSPRTGGLVSPWRLK